MLVFTKWNIIYLTCKFKRQLLLLKIPGKVLLLLDYNLAWRHLLRPHLLPEIQKNRRYESSLFSLLKINRTELFVFGQNMKLLFIRGHNAINSFNLADLLDRESLPTTTVP